MDERATQDEIQAANNQINIGVSVIIVRGDQALLVKRAEPPYKGLWAFPGGKVEWGETLNQAARREVLEETGLDCCILGQVATLDVITRLEDNPSSEVISHFILVVMAAMVQSGDQPIADSDALEALFRDPYELDANIRVPNLHKLFDKARALFPT